MSEFSSQLKSKIEHFLGRYETKRSAILPILHAIQDEDGWIQSRHIEALEKEYGLHRVHVEEVARFYSMYRLTEPKPFRILVCNNIVCSIMGADKTVKRAEKIIEAYEKQGKTCPFSLEGVPCLGVCDGAPALLVNKDRYLRIDEDEVGQVLNRYDRLPL